MKFSFAIWITGCLMGGVIGAYSFIAEPVLAGLSMASAGTPTVDATGTAAAATINAVFSATPSPAATPSTTATPAPSATLTATALPATPNNTATQMAQTNKLATAVAATLTARPTVTPTATPTPHLGATATAQAGLVATAIAATLTARALSAPTSTTIPTPRPTSTPVVIEQAVVDADGKLNVRAGPNARFSILAQLNPGDSLTILGRLEDASWVQIQTTDGRIGWVSAAYVKSPRAVYTYPIVAPPSSPVATSLPTAVACSFPVAPAFAGAWNQQEMGCATEQYATVWASYNPFEHGFMVWRRDTNTLYAFFDSGGWQAIPDKWDGKTPPRSRGAPPAGLQAPVRGSGWIWGNNDAIFRALGWATDQQKGFCALVQTFEHGFLLRSSTVEFCHEEKLYNVAREGDFGLDFILAHNPGDYWRR